MPGLRLGVLASSDIELISWMKKDISIWNINSFAEFYMQIFSKYTAEYNKACHKFIAERRRFRECLDAIPYLRILPSQANYFCCEVTNKFTSTELTMLLRTLQYNDQGLQLEKLPPRKELHTNLCATRKITTDWYRH